MKNLVLASIFLALFVIVLGAYTRLTDAGLGCPDWPGCYGTLLVPQTEELVEKANQAFPERPVEAEKAWNEMIHRYFAAGLGFFILIIFIASLVKKLRGANGPIKLPFALLLLVCFQGALGMWTVTLNLLPVVVMAHLLGGFTVISCLFLLYLRLTPYRIPGGDSQVRQLAKFGSIGIVILVWQIALGGWTSANYASLACTELPICEGNWFSNLDIAGAFSVPAAENYEFGVHDYEERATMHVFHRIGAIITFIYLCWFAVLLYQRSSSGLMKRLAVTMTLVLGLQVILGVSNVVYSLPLVVATMHNAVAACLLLVMVMITYTMYRKY
ncbi:COX15/CtaA family protein [Glaciecola sp. MH2013]|uniref:COX15/CtaA family protein n=1 Tax=Glaciecola sp. MH2013 TaxID=2785524 RepID=UPI00189CF500|nr:COX15/CtaA family protein [Glaciecola sp. MH2013]MBF7074422.1 COX15/CtaA family protein [Glaciecola sp. MH2013]